MSDAANEKDRPFPRCKLWYEDLGGKERCVVWVDASAGEWKTGVVVAIEGGKRKE